MVGIWFFLNLLLGVIFLSFSTEEKKVLRKNLNENQSKWIEITKMMTTAEPLKYSSPQSGIKKHVLNIISSSAFKLIIWISLFMNVCLLTIYYDNQSKELTSIVNFAYYLLWTFYLSEMILKIYALGFCPYIYQNQHKIEILIVLCNFTHILLINSSVLGSIQDDYTKLCITKLLNMFRLTILLRIIRLVKSIENLFNSLKFAFPLLFNLILILLMTLFIYSLVGCLLFNSVTQGKIVDDYINFGNVFYGMMTLFKCVTCDNWADIMLDFSKSPPDCIENVDCGSSKKNIC